MSLRDELYQRGLDLFGRRKYAEAIECYRKAIEAVPNDADLWMALSMAFSRDARLDEAIRAGLKAVELNPTESLLHTNLSLFYVRKGMPIEAEREAQIARERAAEEQGLPVEPPHGRGPGGLV